MIQLSSKAETFPIAGVFRIARGARTQVTVVMVEAELAGARGRGECVPYTRYGETLDGVREQIARAGDRIAGCADEAAARVLLAGLLPAGAARNAIDCALWDLEAKRKGIAVWQLAGLPVPPRPLVTAFTLSVDTPEAMAHAAARAAHRPLLKLKLTGDGDLERVAAVRRSAPESRLIVDANEGWREEHLDLFVPELARLGVTLIEQPLPAGEDGPLAGYRSAVPFCADEACHVAADIAGLAGKYAFVNIKLDKAGGLTEALAARDEARRLGMGVMVGCMLASSLAMAPAVLVAQGADFTDLDGPLLLAADREPALAYEGSVLVPPPASLWG